MTLQQQQNLICRHFPWSPRDYSGMFMAYVFTGNSFSLIKMACKTCMVVIFLSLVFFLLIHYAYWFNYALHLFWGLIDFPRSFLKGSMRIRHYSATFWLGQSIYFSQSICLYKKQLFSIFHSQKLGNRMQPHTKYSHKL